MCNSLVNAFHYPVEDLLIDTYHFFHGSSKRRKRVQGVSNFARVDMEENLKHVSTRWSSLKNASVVPSANGKLFKVIQ